MNRHSELPIPLPALVYRCYLSNPLRHLFEWTAARPPVPGLRDAGLGRT